MAEVSKNRMMKMFISTDKQKKYYYHIKKTSGGIIDVQVHLGSGKPTLITHYFTYRYIKLNIRPMWVLFVTRDSKNRNEYHIFYLMNM